VNGDHRAFWDATLPYLDVACQVARHAAGDGQEPGDLAREVCLRACAGFAPLIAGAAPATAPGFVVASSIGLRRFGTSLLSGRGLRPAGPARRPADAGGTGPGEQGLPCPG
jgi:hypothetical protein